MDWDSPATKKHVKEAKAQGCELIGPGRNVNNRAYLLSCGHEQIIEMRHMREGGYRCRTCLQNEMTQEAEAQGCVLLGPGRTKFYRTYRLPCGHEQESQRNLIRKGEISCQTCLHSKLKAEAEAQGCVLLDDISLRQKGRKIGASRNYLLPCGHEQRVQHSAMRVGRFRCQTCQQHKFEQEAEAQGCELLGEGTSCHNRLYQLPCGHKQIIETGNMRRGEGHFQCQICLGEKLVEEAQVHDCQLLGKGRNINHRTYLLPCEHEQEITLQNMRLGNFLCQTCEETSRSLPSNVYLLHIKVDSDEWLKLGYAKSVDFRASQYGLPPGAKVRSVKSLPFDTGNDAHAFEAAIHTRHKRKQLPQKHVKALGMKSGFKECYPVTMLDTLIDELKKAKETV